MVIYNVTVHVEDAIREDWLQWMQQTHIPQMLGTGKFSNARICRVHSGEETGGVTYAVQYSCGSFEQLQEYYDSHADILRQRTTERFGDRCLAFRTELELISEH